MSPQQKFEYKIAQIKKQSKLLISLRKIINTPKDQDITEYQWKILQDQLNRVNDTFQQNLETGIKRFMPSINDVTIQRKFNAYLGDMMFDLAEAYRFYDTFQDILTQRLSPMLGKMLTGYDTIASYALKRDHPRITKNSSTYCCI